MFAVIYRFNVKPGKHQEFILAWEELTKLIYTYEGSLGSRLHTMDLSTYLAYAQWPDKKTWEEMGSNLPEEAKIHSVNMKDSCEEITTMFQMDVESDLMKSHLFKPKK